MTTWWWVRHGPTRARSVTGWRDVPADLSDRAALGRLDRFLPRPALLISSDLRRAAATADALGAGRERLDDEPQLREFSFGAWEGLGFAEISRRDPELSRRFWERPGAARPPGGESRDDLSARVGAAVAALGRRHRGADIVAVAHMGVILTQLAPLLGGPAAALAQPLAPLSVSCIRQGDGGAEAGPINHCP